MAAEEPTNERPGNDTVSNNHKVTEDMAEVLLSACLHLLLLHLHLLFLSSFAPPPRLCGSAGDS